MKDLSLFLVKNNLGAKMKKGFRNLCTGDGSTSTLNQHCKKSSEQQHFGGDYSSSCMVAEIVGTTATTPPRTLEDMILQLELEEEIARKSKLDDDYYGNDDQFIMQGRMSCVNNSDILRSARNAALNHYPRFSLDGKDAMYRSSFHHNLPPSDPILTTNNTSGTRSSACCRSRTTRQIELEQRDRFVCDNKNSSNAASTSMWCTNLPLPPTIAGESVIWCKPGVVAKLMGLDAIPVPILIYNKLHSTSSSKERLSSIMKKQSLRRIAERRELERRRRLLQLDVNNGCLATSLKRGGTHADSCSRTSTAGYNCVMKRPIHVVQPMEAAHAGWPTPRFM